MITPQLSRYFAEVLEKARYLICFEGCLNWEEYRAFKEEIRKVQTKEELSDNTKIFISRIEQLFENDLK